MSHATRPLIKAVDIAAEPESRICHPFNAKSDVYLRRLSAAAGLTRAVLTMARLPPGRESFAFHWHERDEEFIFILSGRGRAEIGDEVFEVGPGDFMGFTAPGVPHHLINPYDEDLIYLMGGERSSLDIGHFPRIGKRLLFGPSGIGAVDETAIRPMSFADWQPKTD